MQDLESYVTRVGRNRRQGLEETDASETRGHSLFGMRTHKQHGIPDQEDAGLKKREDNTV